MFLSSEYMLKSLEAHAPKSSFSVFILMKKKKKIHLLHQEDTALPGLSFMQLLLARKQSVQF